jgi:hypothetical protein
VDPSPWLVRVAWLALPATVGVALGQALRDASGPVQVVAGTGAWCVWTAVLVATLLPRTSSLTAVRIAAPALAAAAVAAAIADPSAADVVALTWSAALVAVAFLPWTGDAYVDGSSYGDERRLPLRAPTGVLLGPVEVAWALTVAGLAAGPLLLAAQQWAAGAAALVVGLPVAYAAVRRLHVLSKRWVVFVPAGVVLHDPLALAEPQLFPRALVASLGPAPAGSDALDLTLGALGLPIELRVVEPVEVVALRAGRSGATGERVAVGAVLFSPTRPGAALAEARARRFG